MFKRLRKPVDCRTDRNFALFKQACDNNLADQELMKIPLTVFREKGAAYAEPGNEIFPCHTKEASKMSWHYFMMQLPDMPTIDAQNILKNFLWYGEKHGLLGYMRKTAARYLQHHENSLRRTAQSVKDFEKFAQLVDNVVPKLFPDQHGNRPKFGLTADDYAMNESMVPKLQACIQNAEAMRKQASYKPAKTAEQLTESLRRYPFFNESAFKTSVQTFLDECHIYPQPLRQKIAARFLTRLTKLAGSPSLTKKQLTTLKILAKPYGHVEAIRDELQKRAFLWRRTTSLPKEIDREIVDELDEALNNDRITINKALSLIDRFDSACCLHVPGRCSLHKPNSSLGLPEIKIAEKTEIINRDILVRKTRASQTYRKQTIDLSPATI